MSQKLLPAIPDDTATDWRPVQVKAPQVSIKEQEPHTSAKTWKPVTLQLPYLAAMIVSTASLIVLVQYLLALSIRQQGIIFASDINSLPLSKTFGYLYLPTIISVIYSFLWTWVDLDIKRLEPFFQLSKPGGARGSESILLSYPLEFLATIPLTAFKRKHWSVLTVSTIMILVFWGLTPTQAGIFAVRTVHIVEDISGAYSTSYVPLAQQWNLSASYAQSVYNIAWLNETLPSFMTKQYALQPFAPLDPSTADGTDATYTGPTRLYSVDLSCEDATLWNRSGIWYYNSSSGCSFNGPRYRPDGGTDQSKPFDTLYVGYQNQNGFAQYDLSSDCHKQFLHLFFIRWSKSTPSAIVDADRPSKLDPTRAEEASLFCQANYYQQDVNATIAVSTQAVVDATPLGAKLPLPVDLFNSSDFEWVMSSGLAQTPVRGDFPTRYFPEQESQLINMSLNLAYVPPMAPFAIATDQRPPDSYLKSDVLQSSYESAYRLLFARQINYVLGHSVPSERLATGKQAYTTQAVVVVPGFAYATITMLSVILVLAFVLECLVVRRPNFLRSDPSTIGALMMLTAGGQYASSTYETLDECTGSELTDELCDKYFKLNNTIPGRDACLRTQLDEVRQTPPESKEDSAQPQTSARDSSASTGIRPTEMNLVVGVAFLSIQITAAVVFLVLYVKAQTRKGLPLPSQSTIARQIVENYLPIAFATFIEPFWLVLNRLLGLLQPFESLRKGNASASKSVDLDYSSLPPQLLLFRALKARHLILASVCVMVLLANVLAVALSGLMYEGTEAIAHAQNVSAIKTANFLELFGKGPPFNSNQSVHFQGSTTMEQFYREMSNLTADTPLPAWNDGHFAYAPVDISRVNDTASIQLQTHAIGAELSCEELSNASNQSYKLTFSDAWHAELTVHIQQQDGAVVNCTNSVPWTRINGHLDQALNYVQEAWPGHSAVELNAMLSTRQNDSTNELLCRQFVVAAWIRADLERRVLNITTSPDSDMMEVISENHTVLLCTPTIHIGPADIQVDSSGRVQQLLFSNATADTAVSTLGDNLPNLIAQANQFLMDSDSTWHTDSYPSDWLNYLIKAQTNDTSLLDPSARVPNADKAAAYLSALYTNLFAMLVSTNFDLLLQDTPPGTLASATVLIPETRILFSTPAFIVTEVILLCYIITTLVFYVRRPWKILPRLLSTVASNIAFFAGSRALRELGSEKEAREKISSWRWGYGLRRDGKGRVSVGIDREPYVTAWQKEGQLGTEQGETLSRNRRQQVSTAASV